MPTPVQLPDGRYDTTHTWQNANDRVSAQRSFSQDPVERQKIEVALACASPSMPEAQIAANLSVPGPPERFGRWNDTLTIWDMFSRDLGHANDFPPSNFSGSQGQFSGTSTPALPSW
jgi:hypothetical protein